MASDPPRQSAPTPGPRRDGPEVRAVEERDIPAAFALLRVLRPHLDEPTFREKLSRQRAAGYQLIGAWHAGVLVGLIGLRETENLAWGRHVHVDDLIVEEQCRCTGVGRILMSHAEEHADREGLTGVYLEARPSAIGFYEREGYEQHPSPVMKKLRRN